MSTTEREGFAFDHDRLSSSGMSLEESISRASRADLERVALCAAEFWNARCAARGGTLDVAADAEWSRRLGDTLRRAGVPLLPATQEE